ncbi:HAD family phosphatase [Maribacter sp. PR1]|uniref:HAD family phosphatase n=1 Tax=Maribacter cobaltidurans TaxID=1178778 RepID=A0ABU7IUM3_9FLAO|nr:MULTISPECIES: HAD family phosphatase [Maribacter]MDC6389203.1 HAD family phosphatase [Maribacter sp. PR1]MEE1976590.1 HAD family phosphatase [Maribacter cobaltidurans]
MDIKGVIFDFNGTLFFDTHLHNQAWDIFLKQHSMELSYDEKNKNIHGKNNAEILSNLFSKKLSLGDIERLSIEKEDIYQSLCLKQDMKLAQGAEDFLEYLLSKEIPFTIATASDFYNLEFYFEHLNLARYFDMSKIVYSNGKIKSKPNPEIFLKAMDILKINANQTLIFEDSTSGIKAAENSNAKKIIIVKSTDGNYDEWNHQIISSFSEVDKSMFVNNCR